MCTNCHFSTKVDKRKMTELLKQIDAVISFKGKKIDRVALNATQYNLLKKSLNQKEIELHDPMHRNGVLLYVEKDNC